MTYINAANVKEAVEKCNKERLMEKNKWIFLEVEIDSKIFLVKQYDTWIQRFETTRRINDEKIVSFVRSGPMGCNVGTYKQELTKMFKEFL
jgi:hypothetical protein